MKKDITWTKIETLEEAENVVVNKKTGEYYLRGKYNNRYYLGKRILTSEEENA